MNNLETCLRNDLDKQLSRINLFYIGKYDVFDIESPILNYLNDKEGLYQEIHENDECFTRYHSNITGFLESHFKNDTKLEDIEYIIKLSDILFCQNLAGTLYRNSTLEFMKNLIDRLLNSDKILLATVYNPIIFDTIDLNDDRIRLFAVYNDKNNNLYLKRITIKDKPKSSVRDRLSRLLDDNKTYSKSEILELFDNSPEPLKLSEVFLRGYI